jgi:hypothetical protein
MKFMRVFLSYVDQDKALAMKVAKGLEQAGLDVWDVEREILPGDNWAEKIAQGLRESEAIVVLLSPNSIDSKQVEWTIHHALGSKSYDRRLIPVLVGPSDKIPKDKIPWIFHHLKMINLPDQGTQEESIEQIADALKEAA